MSTGSDGAVDQVELRIRIGQNLFLSLTRMILLNWWGLERVSSSSDGKYYSYIVCLFPYRTDLIERKIVIGNL